MMDLRELPTDELRWRILRYALAGDWSAWAHARLEWHRRLTANRRPGVLFTERDKQFGGGDPAWQTDLDTDSFSPPRETRAQPVLPF